ncbi:hypothetical protein [Tunturiibacter gelidiferens]
MLYRLQGRAVFVYGFEKKDFGNIKANEFGSLPRAGGRCVGL